MRAWSLGQATLPVLILLGATLSGCLGAPDTATIEENSVPLPGEGLDTSRLSEAVYDILPKLTTMVDVTTDEDRLYVEVFRPDGEGPWPTILELSPYNVMRANGELDDVDMGGHTSLVERYVPRGYAVVLAHVRGTGNSEGCMDMMGSKERQDAHDLVEWIAEQDWSDGKVGMQGVSYVGTTPHEALVMAPEHLVTVVTVAGVTNQWRNTYQNGVPYQGRSYPITYEAMSGAPPPLNMEEGPNWLLNAADAACDQDEALMAMAPGTYEKGVYTDYWHDRNQTRFAQDATASILYSQGFTDRAVNPMEAVDWFNDLDVPKKAFLHQAGHQYPPREDYADVELAWFDHWLKGIENGIMDTPTVEVQLNEDRIRVGDTWPPVNATHHRLFLGDGTLSTDAPAPGHLDYVADLGRNGATGILVPDPPGTPNELTWTTEPLEQDLHLAGPVVMHLAASSDSEHTYFLFDLYDVGPDGTWQWLSEGWFNAHLRDGVDRSTPLVPGEEATMQFRFEPREYMLEEGHSLGLSVHGSDSRVLPVLGGAVTQNSVHLGPDGSWIEVPVLEEAAVFDAPESVTG